MTEYSEIICDYFMVQQSDTRLQDELEENQAKFFRKMSMYMKNAIPMFNRPPDVRQWLTHTDADFDDYSVNTTSAMDDGDVTLQEVVGSGVEIQLDFYTDGYFDHDLTDEMKNILGLCLQYVWERRFNNDFLYRTPKVKDRNFDTGNEANWISKGTERLRAIYGQLNSAMIGFEQALSANETIPAPFKHRMPLQ